MRRIGSTHRPGYWFPSYHANSAYREHVTEDLRPYVCLHEDCKTPFVTYASQYDWKTHLERDHAARRMCPMCQDCGTVYTKMTPLLDHLRFDHGVTCASLIDGIFQYSKVKTIGVCQCPLCHVSGNEWDARFIDHVFDCMHTFALRSLPWVD